MSKEIKDNRLFGFIGLKDKSSYNTSNRNVFGCECLDREDRGISRLNIVFRIRKCRQPKRGLLIFWL